MKDIKDVEAQLMRDGFSAFTDSIVLMRKIGLLPKAQRRGIYVHLMADKRSFSVGLSKDVRSRYKQHLKAGKDIVLSAFLSVPTGRLGILEQKYISKLYQLGLPLRNILIPDEDSGAGDLSDVFGQAEENVWLKDNDAFFKKGWKAYDQDSLEKFKGRYRDLMKSGLCTDEYLDFLALFIRACLPHPEKTEKVFWTLNCLTAAFQGHSAKALLRVSVHRPEVLTFVVNESDPKMPAFMVMFTVSTDVFTSKQLNSLTKRSGVSCVENVYKSADFAHHQVRAHTMPVAWSLLRDPVFRRGIKDCVLKLMGKGQVPRNFSQSHCLPLCAEVMQRKVSVKSLS